MSSEWSEGFDAGVNWYKHYLKETKVNQHDPKHYYFHRQDPNPYGYWDDPLELKPSVKEVVIGSIALILAFVLIGSVLFLN
jgi:hypothetical protein